MFLLWIRTSDGQLDVISYITFSIYFIRQFKTYLPNLMKIHSIIFTWCGNHQTETSMSLIYMKLLIFMLCFAYSELCNSCLLEKWKERGIPLFAQHFSAFRAMLTSFQYSLRTSWQDISRGQELLDSFFEFLAIEIWNVFNWCVLQPQTHLYIFFMGDRARKVSCCFIPKNL